MAEQNPTELDFPIPVKGVFRTSAHHRVPEGFCAHANNFIAYDVTTGRNTPAQRPGTAKFFVTTGTNALNFGNGTNGAFVQYMGQVNVQDTTAGATLNKLVIVGGGRAYLQLPTDTTLNRIDGAGSPTFSAARRVSHVAYQNTSFFTDGLVAKMYDHAAGGPMADWTPTAGAVPVASARYPRYLALWRGRVVMAYMEKGNPGLWFMSAQGGPRDFDYGSTNGATIAVASNSNYRAGQMGDQVNAIIPANEDNLYFGLDHSFYKLQGDPEAGGSLVPVSETIGILNNDAWCMVGTTTYFMSNVGLCRLPPGGEIQPVSDLGFKELYKDLPQVGHYIELEYDAKRSLVWIFVTKETAPFTTLHACYDLRAEQAYGLGAGFWPIGFPADTGGDDLAGGTTAPRHGPTKACVFDGASGTSSARLLLLGGRDGYVRQVSDAAIGSDDGTAISSKIWLGPLQPAGSGNEFLVNGHRVILGNSTDTAATWHLLGGADPYAASNAASLDKTGAFTTGGRQGVLGHRLAANSVWATLENATLGKTVALERWTALVAPGGPNRG